MRYLRASSKLDVAREFSVVGVFFFLYFLYFRLFVIYLSKSDLEYLVRRRKNLQKLFNKLTFSSLVLYDICSVVINSLSDLATTSKTVCFGSYRTEPLNLSHL